MTRPIHSMLLAHLLLPLAALGLMPGAARAEPAASVVITTGSSTVAQLVRYGDELPAYSSILVVRVTNPLDAAVCAGGWIENNDRQFRDLFQMLLTAQAAGLHIRVDGDPARLYPGSSEKFCYLNLIVVVS